MFVIVVVYRASLLVAPASLKYVIDDVILARNLEPLWLLAAAMTTSSVIAGVTSFTGARLLGTEGARLTALMRCRIHQHVVRLPLSFHEDTSSGVLARRVVEDPSSLRTLFGLQLMEFMGAVITAVFCLVFIATISPMLTAVALAGVATIGSVSARAFAVTQPQFRQLLRTTAELSGRVVESMSAIRIIKGYCAEVREARGFAAGAERLRAAAVPPILVAFATGSLTIMTSGCLTALLVYLGARQVIAGSLSPGDLVTFLAFVGLLTAPILYLPSMTSALAEAIAMLARVGDLLGQRPEETDPCRTQTLTRAHAAVSLDNVSFAYEPGHLVLRDITFTVDPRSRTTIVGASGAGKSTLLALIAGFYKPTRGAVRVNGVDLSTVKLDSYRRQLGLALQDTFVFDGTIRDNVAFVRPDATEREIREAYHLAHVHEFVSRLPLGYDTVVGERGTKLSAGQRQRISIARAILADPEVVILDEATSNLDAASEAAVQDGLEHLMLGRTTFIVTHRLTTMQRADRIIVLEAGHIVEQGSHEMLWAASGRYAELCMREFAGSPVAMPPSYAQPSHDGVRTPHDAAYQTDWRRDGRER